MTGVEGGPPRIPCDQWARNKCGLGDHARRRVPVVGDDQAFLNNR